MGGGLPLEGYFLDVGGGSPLTLRSPGHYGSPRPPPDLAILLGEGTAEPGRTMSFALSEEQERQFSDILSRYPNKMAACIPALHLCQEANENWVNDEVVTYVAEKLELSPAHVKGVATFYHLFNREKPGKNQVWVCHTLSCALRGGEGLVQHCEKKLGIQVGQTTPDGKVTLRTAECLASCGSAPMMQVNKEYHEDLTTDRVDEILDQLLQD